MALTAIVALYGAAPPSATPSPSPSPSGPPAPGASGAPPPAAPAPGGAPTPTPVPLSVAPAAALAPIGSSVDIMVSAAISPLTAVVSDPAIAAASVDQNAQRVTIFGKAPGTTSVRITDMRGVSRDVPIRVGYYAGSVAPHVSLALTGDPASPEFVREQVARAVKDAAGHRADAQVIVTTDDVPFHGTFEQDNVASFDVPVLIQGTNDFEVDGKTRVDVSNIAVPRISPDSLMVSDYPERLTENGTLFTADLQSQQPSRFLYFHYNPKGEPDRRIVLRAENRSREPSIVQFISGRGGPSSNEMDVGHTATRRFLVNVVQNQGRLLTINGNSAINIVEQDLPAGGIVCNLLQLRVLSGGNVHLTLFAQDASADPNAALEATALLESTKKHARGIYPIAEFHFATHWRVNEDYLELPIGAASAAQRAERAGAAGDYGVLQSFVVNLENPGSTPQRIAIYENPRGGRSTGSYLIDGVLVQSHQVPAYSRYKVRQYVVPANGFVRVAIVTMPEAGSSLPVHLIFAPDDGSVSPGAPGSPIY